MRFSPMPVLTTGRIAFGYSPTMSSWFRMEPSPDLVPEARHFTRRLLYGCEEDYVDDAEVVTSELVTNALNHALRVGPPPKHVVPGVWLGVQVLKDYVHLYVRDPYPAPPVMRMAADTDTSGRGLLIVEMLTAAFWVESRAFDKTAHAIITKPGVVLTEVELDLLRQ
ncbi:anti-sigma regulatory factor (Ser/Thr protein kinase) [Actinoallomurus bryophytorum]|uniref:Anti-sigma regulatory factor (Ser/Thr protein kinase) n=1 Tax=Actinoallomurus bryophytorum TaxID=1490222 RepID=A0A543C169_9ACTN|nr:ATP-binding protein [Actinoallomurus bryophytorum]TQL90820.1 anti-sigma regulatory factor (Ser/Thr protein kinase) [Actinoallomurus bryophytorum]